jgi:hypothetical protein
LFLLLIALVIMLAAGILGTWGQVNVAAAGTGAVSGGKGENKPPFFDCGKDPYKWNPYSGGFQRQFIKWCDPWTFDVHEQGYHGMTCDEVACAMGFTPAEFCDFSEGGVPPEMMTCPDGES